jgi:GntR family transcriptional regulator/MocR family aminotransferase
MMNIEALLEAPLRRAGAVPLHRQIYERVRQAILQGQLAPGQRVASARALASQLGLARGTVDAAYAQLAVEGYLEPMGQKGTRVSPEVRRAAVVHAASPRESKPAPAIDGLPAPLLPFQMGMPALDAFPRKLWARIGARRVRAAGVTGLAYPDPRGSQRLRRAVAGYLLLARGVDCDPDQVFITAGHRASVDLVLRLLVRPGDRVCIEDPYYPAALEIVRGAGARVAYVPVDGDGLRVDRLVARHADARLAIVTPAHQAPLGVSLTLARRMALLAWASANDAWILEDDYDSEFRYVGAPLPALRSVDPGGRVLYAGSFSKVLHPGLALAYLVVPASQVRAFTQHVARSSNGCSLLQQDLIADFMDLGHFPRHIRKMRTLYARRRQWLADALRAAFGSQVRIDLQAGGMHLLARFPRQGDDGALADRAQAHGLAAQALSRRSSGSHAGQGLLLGFTNIRSQDEAHEQAARLASALGIRAPVAPGGGRRTTRRASRQ